MEPEHKSWLLLGCFSTLQAVSLAQGENCNDSLSPITYIPVAEDSASTAVVADSATVRCSFLKKFLDYFDDANREEKNKKFDFSIIGGPHYSSDTKLGLGLVAAGLYRTDRADTLLPFSTVSLYGDVSVVGFYLLGVRGNHIFPKDKYRLNYSLYFYSLPNLYQGIGYRNTMNNKNESSYKRSQAQVKVNFMSHLAENFYLGPMASFDYIDGRNFERPEFWQGMDTRTADVSAGLSLIYDSWNFLTNAYKGHYLRADQRFNPAFLGNGYAFSNTELTTSYYRKVWKGGILAGQSHTLLTYGSPPWRLMAALSSSYSIRGYCDGRFRGENVVGTQVEFRQHTWKRNGVAVQMGAGSISPDFSSFGVKHILPNYGFGYRWEFKKRANVRLDLGFGEGRTGFMFNINEAS